MDHRDTIFWTELSNIETIITRNFENFWQPQCLGPFHPSDPTTITYYRTITDRGSLIVDRHCWRLADQNIGTLARKKLGLLSCSLSTLSLDLHLAEIELLLWE